MSRARRDEILDPLHVGSDSWESRKLQEGSSVSTPLRVESFHRQSRSKPPYHRAMYSKNPYKFTPEARAAAVRAMALTGNRSASADAAGVCLSTIEAYLANDEEFKDQMVHAKSQYVAMLEAEATRRAVEGWDEDRMGAGGILYTVKKFSDPLLLHMLKKKAPEEHGDSMKIDQTTKVEGSLGLHQLSRESREQLRQILERESDGQEASED